MEIDEINILSDLAIYEEYKHTIPVVVLDGSFTISAPIRKEDILEYLTGVRPL